MAYTKEQKDSFKFWIKGALLVGLFGIATAWIVFPFAWLLRKKGRDSFLWWWMDDERIVDGAWAGDYLSYIVRKGGNPYSKENWWIAWNWHTRNSVWNLKRDKFLVDSTPSTSGGNNNIEETQVVTDNLYRLNNDLTKTNLNQEGKWVIDAGLKYTPKHSWEDIWQVNKGDYISYRTSILGEGMMWFKATGKDRLMFRYSQCKLVKYKIFGIKLWHGWRTLKMGYGNMSYTSTVKHQRIKPWK